MTEFEDFIPLIEELQDESLACITSMLYHRGLSGIRYFDLRKRIFKELQRIDSKRHKKYTE
jgi:hypothetical protein